MSSGRLKWSRMKSCNSSEGGFLARGKNERSMHSTRIGFSIQSRTAMNGLLYILQTYGVN